MPHRAQHYAHAYGRYPETGAYDYGGNMTGTNGLATSPWPSPSTSGETMDKIKLWLDKPTVASYPSVKNKHVALVTGVAALAGLAWYGNEHRWF